jgi:AraC-like DNA-binding protein
MSVSISLVRSLFEAVAEAGSDPESLQTYAGITEQQLGNPEYRIAAEQYERLVERAVDLVGDASIGLRLGQRRAEESYGILGQLAASCRTLRECIQVGIDYYPLIVDSQAPLLSFDAERGLLGYRGSRLSPRALRVTTEFALARFAQFGRLFLAGCGADVEAWFEYPRPSYADEYRRVFGPKLRFDMAQSGFLIPVGLLDVERPNWDAELHKLLRNEADRALRRLSAQTVSAKTQAVLSELRLGERPEMSQAARRLGLSERGLRRRLSAEGVSFRELVDRVQRERALVLARDPRRSAEAVSDALGFSEVSAFHRAFKRWTGLTPLQYRTGARLPDDPIRAAG